MASEKLIQQLDGFLIRTYSNPQFIGLKLIFSGNEISWIICCSRQISNNDKNVFIKTFINDRSIESKSRSGRFVGIELRLKLTKHTAKHLCVSEEQFASYVRRNRAKKNSRKLYKLNCDRISIFPFPHVLVAMGNKYTATCVYVCTYISTALLKAVSISSDTLLNPM